MISSIFIIIGSFAVLVASIGLFTMPDALCKMHAAAKASTVGISCFAIAYMIHDPSPTSIILSITIVLFLFITMPISCHVLSTRYTEHEGDE